MIKTGAKFIKKMAGLNYQTRWNMYPKWRAESVSEHTFNVAMLVLLILLIKHNGSLTTSDIETVVGSLFHDVEEACTSDIPTLAKRYLGDDSLLLKAATEELGLKKMPLLEHFFKFYRDNVIIRLADALAALIYANEQAAANDIYVHIKNQIATMICKDYKDVFPEVEDFIKLLGISWKVEPYTKKFTHVGEYDE